MPPRHPTVDFSGGALLRYHPGVQDTDNQASYTSNTVELTGNTLQVVELT